MNPDRILIVDDEPFMRLTLRNLLEEEGYDVTEAASGPEALALLETAPPQAILLDLVMPGMDGLETCRRLRRQFPETLLPVVMITARGDFEAVGAALEAGASDFLPKPIVPALLDYRIRFLLRSTRNTRELHLSRGRLDRARNLARITSWEWRPGESLIWISDRTGTLLPHPGEQQVPLRRLLLRIPPPERRELRRLILATGASGEPFRIEHRLSGADREQTVVHWGELLPSGEGDEKRLFGILQDVTEQRRDSEDLRLLRQAVECLPMGITITGTDGLIRYTNPAEARMHGYRPEELIGRPAKLLGPAQKHNTPSKKDLANLGCWQRETVNVRKDGSEFPVQLHSVAVSADSGGLLGVITACEDITGRREAEQRIHRLAYVDPLTGLPNRRMFQDRLEQALALASRLGHPLALLFLDLNRFKEINDHFGHPFGDRLLEEVARRLATLCRRSDTLARLGGDEFVFLLTGDSDHRGSAVVCEKILAALAEPFTLEGREVYTGVAIGVALFPEDAGDPEGLLRCADTAMYEAKRRSGHAYSYFTRALDRTLRRKLVAERTLRRVLEEGSLPLLYLPWFEGEEERPAGAEALLEWEGNVGQLGEEIGLLARLQEQLLQAVGEQLREWIETGVEVPVVALPLLEKPFPDRERWHHFASRMEALGVAADRVEFVLSGHPPEPGSISAGLDAGGFRFGLDPFSPAGAELSAWSRLPLARLWLAEGLTRGLPGDERSARLAAGVVGMARSLGLPVLARGIENEEQQRALRQLGCGQLQGPRLAPTMTARQLGDLLPGTPPAPGQWPSGPPGAGWSGRVPGA